jgi:hypothetical protein
MPDLPADAPKTDRELLLQIHYDIGRMKNDIGSKCKTIDRHEEDISRLKMHDYAEMVLIGAGVVLMGWAIAAGFVHA